MNLRQKSTLQIVFVFLLFILIVTTLLVITQRLYLGYSNNQEIIKSMNLTLKEKEKSFASFINQSKQTLHSLRELELFNKYLQTNKDEKTLESIFLAYAKSQPSFMQLRFLDKDGFEKIRVDRKKEKSTPFLVEKSKLQNKLNRYYFSDSKDKELEKVWFSALDLNIENGKVELPYKPTLRAVLPIKYNGKFNGILIINYFMEDFLKNIVDMPLYDMIIFNSKGYTIHHYKKENSWGYYKIRKYNIKNEYSRYINDIFNTNFFETNSFITKKLDIPIYDDIYLLLKLKQTYIQEEEQKLTLQGFYTLVIIVLLSIPISILMVKIFSKTLFNLETVRDLNKELNSMALRNEVILKASDIGIWEWNFKTKQIMWDDHMYDIFGVKKDLSVDLQDVWDSCIGTFELQRVKDEFYESIEKKNEFKSFYWIDTPDGKRKYIKALGVTEYDSDDKAIKMVGINQDITELKQKEESLKETKNELALQNEQLQKVNRELEESEYEIQIINESLEEKVKQKTKENLEQFEVIQQQSKLAAMGEMLGNISHQWRQPLNALSALVFNIKFKYEMDKLDKESVEHFSEKSSSIIKSMNNTIDDFRNFFKPDKQKVDFDICESINSVMNIIEGSYKANDISIDVNCNNIIVNGFKSELEQVLLVTLANSKDAIKENKVADGKVSIVVNESQKDIVIKIGDNGGGVKEDIIKRVFEPYFTTKHQDVGTGIGLYMSKMIIERSMKGTITIENKDDGSLVTIVLPKENR